MGWVSQATYVPAVWGNGGKPGPQPPPPDPVRRAPAPVVEEDTDDKE